VFIHSDGREEEILRRGKPTILEQKDVIGKAVREKSQVLVVEAMSIRPEILRAEIGNIIRPHILVITNVRPDHIADLGTDREKISTAFASAISDGAVVFIPEEEGGPEIRRAAGRRGAGLVPVSGRNRPNIPGDIPPREFESNIRLATEVARHFSVAEDRISAGIAEASPDFGALKIWGIQRSHPPGRWILVSAFAANEPHSTLDILKKLDRSSAGGKRTVGLLSLRRERGDRSLQWKKALKNGMFSGLARIYIVGDQTTAFSRGFKAWDGPEILPLRGKDPEKICSRIFSMEPDGTFVVGMGNMGGMGRILVEYWNKEGEVCEL
jgi:poly-gamma-glutamate synthase PgsB/CapB